MMTMQCQFHWWRLNLAHLVGAVYGAGNTKTLG